LTRGLGTKEANLARKSSGLTLASTMAADVGGVRLQMDAEVLLARLQTLQGRGDAARGHDKKAHKIVQAIEKSLVSSGLEARLRREVT